MSAELVALMRAYIVGVWRRRWLAVGVAWLVCLGGWIAVASLPNMYESRARIFVDTETILAPLMSGLAIYPDTATQVSMMRRTLLSRPNLEELARMTDLDLEADSEIELRSLVEQLGEKIEIKNEGTDIFNVAYYSSNPRTAYNVVDAVLQIFVEQNIGDTQRDVEDARGFIDRQIADYEAQLRSAELAVAEFKKKNAEELGGFERGQRDLESAEQSMRRIQNELEATIWRRDQVRLQLAATPKTASAAGIQLQNPQAMVAQDRVRTLQQELDQLRLVYTDRHPNVVLLEGQIASAKADLARLSAVGGSASGATNPIYIQLESELAQAEFAVAELERRTDFQGREIDRLNEILTTTPDVEADLVRLTRDYDVLLEQYLSLIERREQAQLAKRIDSETRSVEFRIVDPPRVPLTPSGPPHAILHTLVLVFAVGAGLGVAFLHLLLSDTYLNLQSLRDDIGLPVLGGLRTVRNAAQKRFMWLANSGFAAASVTLFMSYGWLIYQYTLNVDGPRLPLFNALLAGMRDGTGLGS